MDGFVFLKADKKNIDIRRSDPTTLPYEAVTREQTARHGELSISRVPTLRQATARKRQLRPTITNQSSPPSTWSGQEAAPTDSSALPPARLPRRRHVTSSPAVSDKNTANKVHQKPSEAPKPEIQVPTVRKKRRKSQKPLPEEAAATTVHQQQQQLRTSSLARSDREPRAFTLPPTDSVSAGQTLARQTSSIRQNAARLATTTPIDERADDWNYPKRHVASQPDNSLPRIIIPETVPYSHIFGNNVPLRSSAGLAKLSGAPVTFAPITTTVEEGGQRRFPYLNSETGTRTVINALEENDEPTRQTAYRVTEEEEVGDNFASQAVALPSEAPALSSGQATDESTTAEERSSAEVPSDLVEEADHQHSEHQELPKEEESGGESEGAEEAEEGEQHEGSEQDGKSYEEEHEHDEGEKGHHDKESRDHEYDEKEGGEKKDYQEAGSSEEQEKGQKGEKKSGYSEKGKHKEGHNTQGEHVVHKKDEFEKKTEFYDEFHDSGEVGKEGAHHEEHQHESGGHFKKGGFEGKKSEGKSGKKGHYEKGHRHHEEKGEEEDEGHKQHHEHEERHGKKGAHEDAKHWNSHEPAAEH